MGRHHDYYIVRVIAVDGDSYELDNVLRIIYIWFTSIFAIPNVDRKC